jgi:molybdate transport system ATP-binding protein
VRVPARDVDVYFEVESGTTTALLGPNGSGKSTVLSVVAGLLEPEDGRVVLDDRVLTEVSNGRVASYVPPHDRGTALLEQDALLFPHLSALENVAFGQRSRGTPRAEARRIAQEWMSSVGIADLTNRRARELSGGQAQRVAIARALAADPSLLMLDEPMAALDVTVQPALRQTLRRVLAGRTAILVTHDPLDALLIAQRVAVIEDGRVVEEGTSAEVLSRPRSRFAARLAGVNWLPGRWEGDRLLTDEGWTVQGIVDGDPPMTGSRAVAAFRPQAVAIYRDPPSGSPRNLFEVTVDHVEPRGDLARVHSGALAADVTVLAVADLGLMAGVRVALSVKAAEVAIYDLGGR